MKILIAVDGSAYSRMALDFVASRKTLLGSKPEVEVINVQWELPTHPARIVGMTRVRDYYAEEAEQALKPARARLHKAGLTPNVRFIVGHPASEIIAAADRNGVDLLVVGSHGHSLIGGMLLGSVTNAVLKHTKRATLVVRGKVRRYPDSLRVGIAVDGSPYGPAAVKYVLRYLELFGSAPRISLIHAVNTYDPIGMASLGGMALPVFSDKETRAMQDKAFQAALAPVRRLFSDRVDVQPEEVRLVGGAGDELSSYANKQLDVLVMGSHGYGAFRAAVMGSVTARVVAHAAVPLLLVRRARR